MQLEVSWFKYTQQGISWDCTEIFHILESESSALSRLSFETHVLCSEEKRRTAESAAVKARAAQGSLAEALLLRENDQMSQSALERSLEPRERVKLVNLMGWMPYFKVLFF